ncbi:MAG: hypothetical protein V1736_12440 [Pseudomonadota bacterium]
MCKEIRAYWMDEKNFGDMLTPVLLEHYGYRASHALIDACDLICAGSVLDYVSSDYSGIILGTGFMWEESRTAFSRAKILALRGRLTWERAHSPENVILGDPGLLSANLLGGAVCSQYALGIVPHYVDKDNVAIRRLKEKYPDDVHVVDVQEEPRFVVGEIAKCENIFSSCLHGLIAADGLAIHSRWLVLSDKVLGNGFKFMDYYSAFGEERTPARISGDEDLGRLLGYMKEPSPKVGDVMHSLDKLFRELDTWLRRSKS